MNRDIEAGPNHPVVEQLADLIDPYRCWAAQSRKPCSTEGGPLRHVQSDGLRNRGVDE
jgi:hypothetical protein